MNTNPDDITLALWLDDELEGEAFTQVEAWAALHPEQLAAREEVRRWRQMIRHSIPASEEPPAAEFFNERIQHAIRHSTQAPAIPIESNRSRRHRWMPLAACAGMALAFWLGMSTRQPSTTTVAAPDRRLPNLYTPLEGVAAQAFSHSDATVIVLTGIEAIPDTVDLFAVDTHPRWREIDSTADHEPIIEP